MKNVTITLQPKVADWARREASRRNMSVSRLIGEMLHREMTHDRDYEAARRKWFSTKPRALGGPGEPLPRREELYDRGRLR